MKALVTGANGLVGANLIRELLRSRCSVRALVRAQSDLRSLRGLPVEIVYGDVLDIRSMVDAACDCDWFFHAASIYAYSGDTVESLESVATEGAINAVNAARFAGVQRLILTSSSVVFGSSTERAVAIEGSVVTDSSPPRYVASKTKQLAIAQEHACEMNVDMVVACPTITVGPHDYRIGPSNGILMSYLRDVFRMTFFGGCNVVSAHDVARGHILVAEHGNPGASYILGSENLTWRQVHSIISELCGIPGPSLELNRVGAYVAALYEECIAGMARRATTANRQQAKMVGRYYWYSHEKASSIGYFPDSARRALALAISWLVQTPQLSREDRTRLSLSDEVYSARRWQTAYESTLEHSHENV